MAIYRRVSFVESFALCIIAGLNLPRSYGGMGLYNDLSPIPGNSGSHHCRLCRRASGNREEAVDYIQMFGVLEFYRCVRIAYQLRFDSHIYV